MNNKNLDTVSLLEKALREASNFDEIEKAFVNFTHLKSVLDFEVRSYLENMTNNSVISAAHAINKFNVRLINSERFIYTAQFCLPPQKKNLTTHSDGDIEPETVWTGNSHRISGSEAVWTSDSQILYVKGDGSCQVSTYELPAEIRNNDFRNGVRAKKIGEKKIHGGEFISNQNPKCFMQIIQIDGPLILETLIVKNLQAELHWIFNSEFFSVDAIPAKPFLGRLKSFLELAIEMAAPVPENIYKAIFETGDPLLQFRAIEAMLLERHPNAVEYLLTAMESPVTILSNKANQLYNDLTFNPTSPNLN